MRLALRRLALLLTWTAVLAVALYGLDRFLLGVPVTGWQPAASVDAIPAAAGPVGVPRYVPERLVWPPRVILYRGGAAPGFWLGLAGASEPEPQLWIGTGADPLPDPLRRFAGCLEPTRGVPCPARWQALSFEHGARVVYLLGDLEHNEMRRTIKGLMAHKRP